MNRTPLDIIVADPTFTVGVRCNGREGEIIISHNAVLVLKPVTKSQITALIANLANVLAQVTDHEERTKNVSA